MRAIFLFGIIIGLISSCQRDDKTPPVLTLNGAITATILIGDPYTDPGATAMDARDGDLSSRIEVEGSVNNLQSGTYVITYTVADFSGNTSSASRTVYVNSTMNAYEGTYTVHDSVWGGAVTDYTDQILASTSTNDRIIANRFGNQVNAAVYFDYYTTGQQLNVPIQTLVCGSPALTRTFSTPSPGSVISTSPITFTVNYQMVEGTNTTNATATYTKQ